MSDVKPKSQSIVKVWDLPIRLFHWGLVAAVATSFISMELENMEVHVISGACVLGLLIFRLLWGLWGSSTAQFHRFIPSPKRLFNYLRKSESEGRVTIGHSAIAALSVVAMLVAIGFQTITGLVADDDVYTTGPLIDYVESEVSEWATGWHATNSDIVLALIGLHIVAILFYKLVKKQSLVKPMIVGSREFDTENFIVENPLVERSWTVFILTAAIAAAIPYVLFNLL
jgi:cytochrome b